MGVKAEEMSKQLFFQVSCSRRSSQLAPDPLASTLGFKPWRAVKTSEAMDCLHSTLPSASHDPHLVLKSVHIIDRAVLKRISVYS